MGEGKPLQDLSADEWPRQDISAGHYSTTPLIAVEALICKKRQMDQIGRAERSWIILRQTAGVSGALLGGLIESPVARRSAVL